MAKIYLITIDNVDIAKIADLLKKRDIAPVDLMTVTPPDGLSARVLLELSRQDINENKYIKGLCKDRAGFYELPGLSRTDLETAILDRRARFVGY